MQSNVLGTGAAHTHRHAGQAGGFGVAAGLPSRPSCVCHVHRRLPGYWGHPYKCMLIHENAPSAVGSLARRLPRHLLQHRQALLRHWLPRCAHHSTCRQSSPSCCSLPCCRSVRWSRIPRHRCRPGSSGGSASGGGRALGGQQLVLLRVQQKFPHLAADAIQHSGHLQHGCQQYSASTVGTAQRMRSGRSTA